LLADKRFDNYYVTGIVMTSYSKPGPYNTLNRESANMHTNIHYRAAVMFVCALYSDTAL